jgi:AmpD protein
MSSIVKKRVFWIAAVSSSLALFLFLSLPKKKEIEVKDASEEKSALVLGSDSDPGEIIVPNESNDDVSNVGEAESIEKDSPSLGEKKGAVNDSDSQKEASPKESDAKINDDLVNWGYQKAENRKIDTVIIHSSYDATSDDPYSYTGIRGEYKAAGVSPHYLIERDGKIYRFVEDKNIAYHAGVSKMPDGRTGVNYFSIGIELVNTKTGKCTDKQYNSLKYLLGDLKGEYPIKNVLGHNQIAPDRKDDPWNFDWNRIK